MSIEVLTTFQTRRHIPCETLKCSVTDINISWVSTANWAKRLSCGGIFNKSL